MDHDLYEWSNLFERPPVSWPDDKPVAVSLVISLEWFPIVATEGPFLAPGHMQTPYPDYRHYTARDYGTRVGFPRLLEVLADRGIVASVATNAAVAERDPGLIERIVAAGHEIVAHSTDMNGTIATGVDPDDERALITRSLDVLERVSGRRPEGWMSIARSESWNTPTLLADAGLRYVADWVNDELPYRLSSPAGSLWNIPVNHELSDRQVIGVHQQSSDSYAEQLGDAHQWLEREAERFGGRFLPIHLTPYIIGLPYRIGSLEALLDRLVAGDRSWFAPLGAVVAAAERSR
jgi:peptidoglycan/xylan/chitin deacetylase (PgdA/CDA1 family)